MKKKKIPTLPDDLVTKILLLLPVKSLLRSKSVCKSWRSLISNPHFAKSHFDLAATEPTHRVLLCTKINSHSAIESLDLDAPLTDNSSVARLNLKVPNFYSFDTLGSCRGFILLADLENHVFIVWNPSTGVRVKIPLSVAFLYDPHSPTVTRNLISASFTTLIGKGIGYDESRDDYLIVLMGLDKYSCLRIEAFSLKMNASYCICGIGVGYDKLGRDDYNYSFGLFFNQSLHWLVMSKARQVPVVLAFNLIDRRLSEILLPAESLALSPQFLNIMGGWLSLCFEGYDETKIWVMKEYNVHSSWTLYYHLALENTRYESCAPIWFTKGVNVLGSARGGLIKFNVEGELIERRACRACDLKLMHYDIYRESLLSLPSYFAKDEEEAPTDEKSKQETVREPGRRSKKKISCHRRWTIEN
ncbi:F-box protein CPR1-like [Lotus japonicus]|uniref:F-box protein CPR1-like n=1 Tax=Lotus japonicus TaxID=34305 RepID=UPI0025873E17|nr:F-box protein CPR1-like [Lotus japonicus]